MARQDTIFIGVQGTIWRTDLKGRGFVNLALQGRMILATTRGEIFSLDRMTGRILWNNQLKGLGLGFVTIAGAAQAPAIAAVHASHQSDGGAAAAAASSV